MEQGRLSTIISSTITKHTCKIHQRNKAQTTNLSKKSERISSKTMKSTEGLIAIKYTVFEA